MGDAIRIIIAEDHPFFRDGLRSGLEKAKSLSIVAEASDGLKALEQVRSLRPHIAILDIGMPRMNGFAVVRAIREEQIPVEIVFLTNHDDEAMLEEALRLGVKGYLLKDCTETELLGCISAVSSGQHYASPSMTTYLVKKTQRIARFAGQTPGLQLLTPRERTILRLIAQEKTSKEIAQEMGIAPKTVDAHRSNICIKLEIHGHHVLTRFAARHRTDI
jgi:DNA-binding NarL/FixJ family response regulator